MRTTFGVLRSSDGGKTWTWLCERSLGFEGTWDPPIAMTRDGRLWIGLPDGLSVTSDGCAVERVRALDGETVKDLTTDARGERLYAVTGAEGKRAYVWEGRPRDAGAPLAFERLGAGLEDVHPMTIEVAPSRARRVYVTGQPYGTVRGRLYVSDDGGVTLKADENKLAADGPLFISSIDPTRPDRVFLRHLHLQGSDLLVTDDRGKTLTNVLSMKSAMLGFAASVDGKTVWAGSGLVDDGVFRSDDGGRTFRHVGRAGVLCLLSAGDALLACANPYGDVRHTLARSTDRGATFTAVSSFADITGPPACAPDAGPCPAEWPATRARITPEDDAGPPRAEVPSAAPSAAPAPAARKGRTCGCDLPGGAGGGGSVAFALGGASLLALRGRRRTR